MHIENASYGLTNCAERTAIFSAVAKAGPELEIVAVAIVNDHGDPCAPCGACRQVIYEFGPRAVIFYQGEKGPSTISSPNFCRRVSASVIEPSVSESRFRVVDLIGKKRDGGALSAAEIAYLVEGYTQGSVPDYQMAAWLMAVVLRGMTREETAALTDAMLHSGEVLDLSFLPAKKVDNIPLAASVTRPRSYLLAGGCRWAFCSHDQRTRTGAHRRHARQLESIPDFA